MPDWYHSTTTDLLRHLCATMPDKTALIHSDRPVTFADLAARVQRLTAWLARLGVTRGTRVAVWLPNRPEWIVVQFALGNLGAIMVPLNTRFQASEMARIVRHCGAEALVLQESFLKHAYMAMLNDLCPELAGSAPGALQAERLPELRHVICLADRTWPGCWSYDDVCEADGEAPLLPASVASDDLLNVMYTSGTTGSPKGIMFKHGVLLRKVHERGIPYGLTADDRLLVTVPLSNVWGMANSLFFAFVHGASLVLQETFAPEEALALLSRYGCTLYSGVPSMFTDLLEHPRFADSDLSALRIANVSAAAVPRDLMEAIRGRMGVEHIVTSYGLSEACGTLTAAYPDDSFDTRCRTVGRRVPHVEVEILDPDTRAVLPPKTPGEICARGYNIMPGYYRAPEATAQVIDAEGWLHTGDRGMFTEDGYLLFLGRIKDMYKRGGFNVYTQDVEEVLLEHPAIQEVAVTGVPDRRLGEEGVAFVKCRPDSTVVAADLQAFCKQRLANYKVPGYVVCVDDFPRSNTGKVMKFQLREQAMHELGLTGDGTVVPQGDASPVRSQVPSAMRFSVPGQARVPAQRHAGGPGSQEASDGGGP
jgi:fatty-acyl-CoA synthase